MLRATALIYSSHNRCAHIHRDWIVERALQSPENKSLLYLPMSMRENHQQEYTWGTFRWYLEQFTQWGLRSIPFFWNPNLNKDDADLLFHYLETCEVVILGGGNTVLGLQRYKELGAEFYGDPNLFGAVLHERQHQGKLTAGFSAGASQLCDYLIEAIEHTDVDPYGFSLARNVMVSLHHEWGREEIIQNAAARVPHCMVFGLPNDSGLAIAQGYLPSGNFWQIIEFVVDCSWDVPEDGWHIKTRQGLDIEHFYCDGRHWTFKGGDRIVRIIEPNNIAQEAWIFYAHGIVDYWTQQPSRYYSIEDILSDH